MKSVAALLLAGLAACGGSANGLEGEAAKSGPIPAVVHLDREGQQHIGLRCEPVAALQRPAEIPAFGTLADPLELARLSSEAEVAGITRSATRDELARLQTLNDEGGNVSLRAVQERRAQLAADEGHARLAEAALERATGAAFAARPAAERQGVIDAMLRGEVGLAHVRPATRPPAQAPSGARLALVERPDQPLTVDALLVSLAPEQGAATPVWLLWVRAAGTPLRAGAAVDARLLLPGAGRDGVQIPRSALVRDAQGAWVFVQAGEESFERRRVTLDSPTTEGWFSMAGVQPGETLVVQGAELLHSEQVRNTIEGD